MRLAHACRTGRSSARSAPMSRAGAWRDAAVVRRNAAASRPAIRTSSFSSTPDPDPLRPPPLDAAAAATNNLRKVSIADTTLAGLPEVLQSKYFDAADELAINHRQLCLLCGSRQPYEPEKEENENNAAAASPRSDALSIRDTVGTAARRSPNRRFSFSRHCRSASTWLMVGPRRGPDFRPRFLATADTTGGCCFPDCGSEHAECAAQRAHSVSSSCRGFWSSTSSSPATSHSSGTPQDKISWTELWPAAAVVEKKEGEEGGEQKEAWDTSKCVSMLYSINCMLIIINEKIMVKYGKMEMEQLELFVRDGMLLMEMGIQNSQESTDKWPDYLIETYVMTTRTIANSSGVHAGNLSWNATVVSHHG
ncbi:hypothetical protein EJB05_47871, partial [Eragrostis curvula]